MGSKNTTAAAGQPAIECKGVAPDKAHPSRGAKLCRDCAYCAEQSLHSFCTHPAAPVEPVRGHPAMLCSTARRAGDIARKPGICGPDAALFRPAPAVTTA